MSKKFTRDEAGTVFIRPDTSMKKKLGMGKSLKGLLNEDVIEKAESAMAANIPEMMNEIKAAMKTLLQTIATLKAGEVATDAINTIITSSFQIKGKAGFCSYPMATSFSRFLYLFCEGLRTAPLSAGDINMIATVVTILSVIFERDFKGDGDNDSIADFLNDAEDASPFAGL